MSLFSRSWNCLETEKKDLILGFYTKIIEKQNNNFSFKMCLPHYLVKISKRRAKGNKRFYVSIFPCRKIGMNYIYFQNYQSEEDPLLIKCSYFNIALAQIQNSLVIPPINWYN